MTNQEKETIKDLMQRIAVLETHMTILMAERPVLQKELVQIEKDEMNLLNRIEQNEKLIKATDDKIEKYLKAAIGIVTTIIGIVAEIYFR
jgi:hypothetical protein